MSGGTILLVVSCIAFYTGQMFFNRLYTGAFQGDPASASPVFSCFYGSIVCILTFLLNRFQLSLSTTTVLLGCVNGFVLFFYNLGMIQAARRGPYSFQSIVTLFGSIVVCILYSRLYWGDPVTPIQMMGILIMLASFVAMNWHGLSFANVKRGYYFWVASLFITNGLYGVLLDAQQRILPDERNEMIIVTYLALALLSFFYLATGRKTNILSAFQLSRRPVLFAVLSSSCAAFAVYTLMILLTYIPSYILFTVNNGSILVLSVVLSAVVLKEKLSKSTLLGIGLSIISIVLLSL